MNSTSYNPIAPTNGVKEMLTTRHDGLKSTLRPQFDNNGHISEFSKTGASALQTSPTSLDKYNLKEIMNNKYFVSH